MWIRRERPDIPPFGYQIDYLTFGGIYREVSLRIVPGTFIENIFAKPKDVLTRASARGGGLLPAEPGSVARTDES